MDKGTVSGHEFSIVDILRARQLAESLKVPDIIDMTMELVHQDKSVVIFMNFRDSVDALANQLNCPKIIGGQPAEARQRIIDDFTKRDAENERRAFDLAQQSNDAINKMAASLEANTKSMDNLVVLASTRQR